MADRFSGWAIAEPLPGTLIVQADCLDALRAMDDKSVHAIITDPPYGMEYDADDHDKLRQGRGGIWRQPPVLDGVKRRALPRFTVLTLAERQRLHEFFAAFGHEAARVLVPGGHLILAANPLLSSRIFVALEDSGLEKRGEIIRLVQTLRGGDRPKGAEAEFPHVSVMPRSGWEPWGVFRKRLDGTVANNLRIWQTGGFRRISEREPFKDVIASSPTHAKERALADHPSLKPQRFLRHLVRAALPMGHGTVLDPFCGSGSTLAAAAALGVTSIGFERDPDYFVLASQAIPRLAAHLGVCE